MSQATLEIKRMSGHAGAAPGAGTSRDYDVCKVIDTTTCIGCKACEVACLEWNGYPFTPHALRQHLPDDAGDALELLEPDQIHRAHQRRRKFDVADAQRRCMHCEEPGCLAACPADAAIVQFANGIVDFQQDHCIGCGYCVSGCPFNIPKFNPETKKVYKCTLCSDRVSQGLEPACIKSCPTGCLHFGSKEDMTALAQKRASQLREHSGHKNAGVYDPAGIGGTHVIYVLHDASNPEAYSGLPKNPTIPWTVRIWKGPLKWIGNLAIAGESSA